MAWAVSSIKDSVLGWLSRSGATDSEHSLLEPARKAMIEMVLFDAMAIDESLQLALLQRLRYAGDLEALWYLRPELVSALALQHGEREAQARVRSLAHLFGARVSASSAGNSLIGR